MFSAKHSSYNKKLYVEKNRQFMKNCGLFLNMAKLVFWVFVFEVLMVLWFVFCVYVSGIVATVLKMFFPQFWGFLCGDLFLFIWVSKV